MRLQYFIVVLGGRGLQTAVFRNNILPGSCRLIDADRIELQRSYSAVEAPVQCARYNIIIRSTKLNHDTNIIIPLGLELTYNNVLSKNFPTNVQTWCDDYGRSLCPVTRILIPMLNGRRRLVARLCRLNRTTTDPQLYAAARRNDGPTDQR